MVYRSQFVIVYILRCRWYDYGKGGVAASAVGRLAGGATIAVGGVAAGEEAESPLLAGMIWFFVSTSFQA